MRQKILTLSRDNFIWETFRASCNGGQNVNKRETAVRVRHVPSGAIAECQEEREQYRNKVIAFKRICKHPSFINWCKQLVCKTQPVDIEKDVDKMMEDKNLKIEYGPF